MKLQNLSYLCLLVSFLVSCTNKETPRAELMINKEIAKDLFVHSIRLASDIETNKFYSISLEPDYSIVEYDL